MEIPKIYNDVRLFFNEAEHKYTDSLGNSYKSTTQLLHDYVPKFNKEYWLHKKAKESGISVKELENKWKEITDYACNAGNKVHNNLEDAVRNSSQFQQAVKYYDTKDGEMITVADLNNIQAKYKLLNIKDFIELTNNKYPDVYSVYEKYTNAGYKIYAEIGFFLIDYLISGTIDVLLVRDDGNYVVGDYKSNRDGLKFEAGFYKKDKKQNPIQLTNIWVSKKETLLPPLTHMDNCNGSIYNLQISLYAKAVEIITGMTLKGLWLLHIDCDYELNEYGMPKRFEDGLYHIKDNPIEKTKFYVMPYRSAEIDKILADRKMKLKANEVKQQFKLEM